MPSPNSEDSNIGIIQKTTCNVMSDLDAPVTTGEKSTLIRHSVTGLEQGIAAMAGFFTAGPLGALASWGVIRGVQGKWTPWFVVGIPAAVAINLFNFAIFMGAASIFNSSQSGNSSSILPNQSSSNSTTSLPSRYSRPSDSQPDSLDTAFVYSVESSSPEGLKIAKGRLIYNDGDVLEGGFRVYCPTRQIRPIDYTLTSASGEVKKTGDWWEKSFPPKWKAENDLIQKVCN